MKITTTKSEKTRQYSVASRTKLIVFTAKYQPQKKLDPYVSVGSALARVSRSDAAEILFRNRTHGR